MSLWRTGEGYSDPTSGLALTKIGQENRRGKRLATLQEKLRLSAKACSDAARVISDVTTGSNLERAASIIYHYSRDGDGWRSVDGVVLKCPVCGRTIKTFCFRDGLYGVKCLGCNRVQIVEAEDPLCAAKLWR